MDVDRAVERSDGFAPYRVEQLLAGEAPARALRQREQQVELIGGHRARLAVDPHHAPAAIQLEAPEAKRCRTARGRQRRPPQDRPQPGQQLARLERLGQVVIGAKLQTDNAIKRVALCRQHQDRN